MNPCRIRSMNRIMRLMNRWYCCGVVAHAALAGRARKQFMVLGATATKSGGGFTIYGERT